MAQCQERIGRGLDSGSHAHELGHGLGMAAGFDRCLGPRDDGRGLGNGGRPGGALDREPLDAQAIGEPGHRRFGRPGLAQLDLAHVLLGEALASELGLRQARTGTKRPHPRADPARGLPDMVAPAALGCPRACHRTHGSG